MKRGDFANLGLFKKNPELLKQGSYTVSSDVNDEVMSAFFGVIEGDPVSTSLSSDDISRLRSLCREMGVDESKFLPSSESESSSQVSKAEFLQLAARNSRLELHIEELSARIRKLELALSGSNSSPILQRVQTLEKRQNDFDRNLKRLETRAKPENTTPVNTDDLKKEIQELKTREDRVESEIARLHDESYVLDFCGTMFYRGWGFSQNRTEAARFFKMSADRCNSSGRAHYGICFYYGHGVERDFSQSAKYFKLSAAQGNCEGQDHLADSYFRARGVTKDWNKAYQYHKLAADQGHVGGYWACGCHYFNAHAVPRDYVKAARLYKIAADMGHADAQYMYGWMACNGKGIKCDYDVAVHYFQLGADQGHVDSQTDLGYCFLAGDGVPQDFTKAAHYFKLAADKGSRSSQFYYGHCLEEGKGVEKNMTEAIRYYKLAADQGNKSAQARLEKLNVTTPK